MATIKGILAPLRDKVFLSDINFEEETSAGGIVLASDNGKGQGIKPRWGRVWAVGPEQQDVKVGEWILMEHARWTREFQHETEDGTVTKLHMADLNAMLMSTDEKPVGAVRGVAAVAGGNFNFNIPG